ncbi:MAG: hypothetical protein OWU84_15035 [Firmicutes bacterium]|nr:hypothetical protein [Bacillota bacterium]
MSQRDVTAEARAYRLVQELGEWAAVTMQSGIRASLHASQKREPSDWVTEIDIAIEDEVRRQVTINFPDHHIIGEERGASGPANSNYVWYVDPIDGTNNFAHRIPWNSFSIALMWKNKPVVGAVVCPYTKESFVAWMGHGAYLNGEHLEMPSAVPWPGSLVMTELENATWWPGLIDVVLWLASQEITLRIMGSSALSLIQLACGRVQGVILGKASPIDTAAAILVTKEVGFSIKTESMSPEGLPQGVLVAAHPTQIELFADQVFRYVREGKNRREKSN